MAELIKAEVINEFVIATLQGVTLTNPKGRDIERNFRVLDAFVNDNRYFIRVKYDRETLDIQLDREGWEVVSALMETL